MRRLALLFVIATALHADGGAVILHQEGPLTITVFASPAPPRAGLLDISVLVQQPDNTDAVLDADVSLKFTKDGEEIGVTANRGAGQNKLLYVASVRLETAGSWKCTAAATRGVRKVQASGPLVVGEPPPALQTYSLYLILPFLCIGILILHQWRVWSIAQTRIAMIAEPTSPGAE